MSASWCDQLNEGVNKLTKRKSPQVTKNSLVRMYFCSKFKFNLMESHLLSHLQYINKISQFRTAFTLNTKRLTNYFVVFWKSHACPYLHASHFGRPLVFRKQLFPDTALYCHNAGCGRHVEAAMKDIPEEDQCKCPRASR